jgi:hypothetical protein
MKNGSCALKIWVEFFLASEGDHKGRPYGIDFVGATLVVALARTWNGLTQRKGTVSA